MTVRRPFVVVLALLAALLPVGTPAATAAEAPTASGRVTDADGTGVDGTVLFFFPGGPTRGYSVELVDGDWETIPLVNPGPYRFLVIPSETAGFGHLRPEYLEDADTLEDATPYDVPPEGLTGLTTVLEPGPRISGARAGALNATSWSVLDADGDRVSTGGFAADGSYVTSALLPGSYRLRFDAEHDGGTVTTYHPGALTLDDATPVPVGDGDVTGVPAAVMAPATGESVVRAADSEPGWGVQAEPSTLDVLVAGGDAAVPTGAVAFGAGGGVLGAAPLTPVAPGLARATLRTVDLVPATSGSSGVDVTAEYGGDAVHAGSSTAFRVYVVRTSGELMPTDPTRIVPPTRLGPGETLYVRVAAPSTADAAVLNVTVADPTAPTYVTVCPSPRLPEEDCARVSHVNTGADDTANEVVVPIVVDGLGADGFLFRNDAGHATVIADVAAWVQSDPYPAQAGLALATAPSRVLPATRLGPGGTTTLRVPGVPPGALAVRLNLTAARGTGNTYLSACPGGTPVEVCRGTSVVNANRRDVANEVTVRLGGTAGDEVLLYNNAGATDVIADLTGWVIAPGATAPGAGEVAVVRPWRAVERTRTGPGGTFTATLPDVPAAATAVVLNVTLADVTASTYLSVCPGGTPGAVCRQTSTVNSDRRDVANQVVVPLGGPDGDQVTFSNAAGQVDVIADVNGWVVAVP